ncbi:MAG TPA: D-amino acid dehydrogenase [Geminicoccaceae bacterium]|jgi:D-amino-acid dehydrogenase|nr:D-amino acid dehydrogenase [Geminicoccaceae bacterium]
MATGTTVVLGAGAVGTASAWYLLKGGHHVEVVERQPAAGLETSWGNGGVIHASEVEPWSQPGMPRKILGWLGKEDAPLLLRYGAVPHMWRWGLAFARNCTPERFRANTVSNLALALHSLRSLQEIGAETGVAYDRAANGVLKIYRSPDSLDAAARGCEFLARHGLLFERVDAAGCVAREPALAEASPSLAGGLYFARDEVGDCSKFTQGLAAACAAAGVEYHYGTAAQRIETSGSRVAGVVTDKGRIAAERVVVALGSFTAPLLRAVGVDVPIYPVKGLSITFPRAGWNSAPRMPVIDDSKLFGLVPIGDRLRISGSAEITGYDTAPAETRCDAIVANASQTFPELRHHFERKSARFWAGLRPVTPAGTPIIGRTRIEGLWVNAGHGHLGWTLACGSGRVLADLVDGRDPGILPPQAQGDVVQSAA